MLYFANHGWSPAGMLTQAQQQLKQAEGGLVTAAAAAARSQNLAEMSDKKARMLLKDNQSLKDLLASYSEEQQMSGGTDVDDNYQLKDAAEATALWMARP